MGWDLYGNLDASDSEHFVNLIQQLDNKQLKLHYQILVLIQKLNEK